MEAIINAIVKAVLNFLRLWYDGERREAAEWEAQAMRGSMESIKASDAVERRMEAVVPPEVTTTAADWNKKARLRGGCCLPVIATQVQCPKWAGLLLLLFILPGCLFTKYVHIEGKWPMIQVPSRPIVPEEPLVFTPRETILVGYSQLLEAKIEAYNEAAQWHNEQHGYVEVNNGGP